MGRARCAHPWCWRRITATVKLHVRDGGPPRLMSLCERHLRAYAAEAAERGVPVYDNREATDG